MMQCLGDERWYPCVAIAGTRCGRPSESRRRDRGELPLPEGRTADRRAWIAAAILRVVGLALTLACAAGPSRALEPTSEASTPITLSNGRLSLRFDAHSGAWTDLVDRTDSESLTTAPEQPPLIGVVAPWKLDTAATRRAVEASAALSLEGEWLYTPDPQAESAAEPFLKGRFDGARWASTPVPSRRGAGDDRLHDRVGDFWYRLEFRVPAGWPASAPLALVIGAVDDFDATYLNGAYLGSTGQETPHWWEAPRYYRIPTGLIRRDRPNVLLVRDTNSAYDGGIAGPVLLAQQAALPGPAGSDPVLAWAARGRQGGTATLSLTARSDTYEYRMEYRLADGRAEFSRRLRVTNITQRDEVLRQAPMSTPALRVGPDQAVIFPGSLPVGDVPVRGLHDGQTLSPRGLDPAVVLWDAGKRRGLGAWYGCEEEYAPVSVRRTGEGVRLTHLQGIVMRLKPGQSVDLGEQYFWLERGSRNATLRGVQRVYRRIGLRAPDHGIERLQEKILYCGHPGGMPEKGFRGYGGFKAVQAYVPTLRKMDIDLLWLLPIWEHGDDSIWNLYGPFDQFRVSPLYGTPDELKALSGACAADGIHLVFDLVPHGPPDDTPLGKGHPEWVCRKEDGTFQYAWGELAFDNAHPGWQDYMRRVAEWDARQYGAVGARVDCGAGSPENWNPEVGDRPSHSTLAGGLGMNRAIREGFVRAQGRALVLPEEYTAANVFCRVADLTYDSQLFFLMADLQERNASPEEWGRALGQFLHDQQITLPPGALKMRWVSNHDTVQGAFQKQRPVRVYGVDRMRALLALCACIEGVPMLYQGDEDPALYGAAGASNVDFLARIYGLRRRLVALRAGTADYASVRATGGVFACLRRAKDQEALALISFNPAAVHSTVSAPQALSAEWVDAESGERFKARERFDIPMQPHQVRVLLRSVPAP